MLHLMIWDYGLTYLHALPDLLVYELHISTVVWLIQGQVSNTHADLDNSKQQCPYWYLDSA